MTKGIRYRYVGKKRVSSLTSHTMLSGQSGSGKTNAREKMAMEYKAKGWKVFDVYDSGRFENHLYSFAEDSPYKAELLRIYTRGRLQPQAHPNSIIWIVGRGLDAYDRLPASVKLRSFESSELRIHDMMMLFGETDARKSMLAEIELAKGQIDFIQAKEYLKRYLSSRSFMRNQAMALIHRINRWQTSGMFSAGAEHLDLLAEAKDQESVTSFCTVCLDPEEEAIVYSLLLRKLLELKRKRLVQHRILVCFGEVSVMTDEMKDIPAWGAALGSLLRVIRQGRDYGLDALVDCQRESDLPPKLRRQFGYHYFMRTNQKESEIVEEVQNVPKPILDNLSSLKPGQCLMVTGSQWEYPLQVSPTTHKHKEPWFDVLRMLGERDGWQVPDLKGIFGGLEEPVWEQPAKPEEAHGISRKDVIRWMLVENDALQKPRGWLRELCESTGLDYGQARQVLAEMKKAGNSTSKSKTATARP